MKKSIHKVGPSSQGFTVNSKEIELKINQIVEVLVNNAVSYLYKLKSSSSRVNKDGITINYYSILIPKVVMEKLNLNIKDEVDIEIK